MPGESPGDWWANSGWERARRELVQGAEGDAEVFLHDVPANVAAEVPQHSVVQSGTPFAEPWPLPGWPPVTTRFLLCRDDRFLPAAFMRKLVRERLGLVPDEIDGGHCVPLSRPRELAHRLESLRLAHSR